MTVVIKSSANKEKIKTLLQKVENKGKLNAFRHLGTIKSKKSPLEIQKKMRSEWG